ncbi:MAG: ferritin [Desulfobacteraceae bacterium]|nr:MAG: ferritin [Desulfobacteraceae bacterium]
MTDYHEPLNELKPLDRDIARALTSLKEEIEAVNWYNQRVAACSDEALKQVLAHNRDEEIEHASMVLEWLRRNMAGWDHELRSYLFSESAITEIEEGSPSQENGAEGEPASSQRRSISIGSLKNKTL